MSNALAASSTYVNTDNLTETQKAEIAMQVAKMKEKQAAVVANPGPIIPPLPEPTMVKRASEWANLIADVGAGIGKGLAVAAKELGVAVNEFSESKVGKMTMFLIVWKVMGAQVLPIIIHVVGGVCFFITMISIWLYMYRRYCFVKTVQETSDKDTGKRISKITTLQKGREVNGDTLFGFVAILAAICGVSIAITFTGGW